MTFVFSQLPDTYNYSYSVRDDHHGNLSSSIDEEPKPNLNPNFTELEPNMNLIFFKVLRTRTEPNPYHQRTRNEHKPKILGSFPSLVTSYSQQPNHAHLGQVSNQLRSMFSQQTLAFLVDDLLLQLKHPVLLLHLHHLSLLCPRTTQLMPEEHFAHTAKSVVNLSRTLVGR